MNREFKKIGRGIKDLRFFRLEDFAKIFRLFQSREKTLAAIFTLLILSSASVMVWHYYINHTMDIPTLGGSYSEGLIGTPQLINPLLAQNQTDKDLARLVYSGLYKMDGNGNLIPDLAESNLQISPDGKTFIVKLKPNLKWHDGYGINADDVLFTVQSLQNPAYKSIMGQLWQNISVKKIDDLTVQFTSKNVSVPFTSNLTIGILPAHIWSTISPADFALTKYELEPIGSGPYFIKQINKTAAGQITSYTLDSYSNYWQGKPYIDEITLKFYENYQDAIFALHSKDINGFGFIPFDTKVYVDQSRTSLHITKLPIFEYQALFLNVGNGNKILGDAMVRQALAQSVDRQNLINNVYFGFAVPAYGPILPGQIGYNPSIQNSEAYDLTSAKATLDKDGWSLDPKSGFRTKDGHPLQFTITTNDFILNVKSAEELQAQWKKIGADVRINSVSNNDLENNYIRTRNFDALLFAESTGPDPDPFVFWHSSQAGNPGFNLSQYKNSQADQLISDARNTFDANKRSADYKKFQDILTADNPAIFLDQSMFVYETGNILHGQTANYLANPEDRFYDVIHWYVATRRIWK